MKKILFLLPAICLVLTPNMKGQNPDQIEKFSEFLQENTPKDSVQTISAVTSNDTNTYYVVISQEGQTGIATLYIQSKTGATRKLRSEEDVDKLILSSTPRPQAVSLIFQLTEDEVKSKGVAQVEAGMQNLINMLGPKALSFLSKDRIEAYKKLGVTIPTTKN